MSSILTNISAKIAEFVGKNSEFVGGTASPSLDKLNDYFKHYRIANILPYRSYDPHHKLFFNEESMGFVFECSPLVGCTEEMQREISGLFQYTLPEHSDIQFIIWADPKVQPWFDKWQKPRFDQSELFEALAQKRIEYFQSLIFDSVSTVPLRNFRCIIAYTQKLHPSPIKQNELTILRDQLITSLNSLGSTCRIWDADDLISTLDGIINFNQSIDPYACKWNPYDSLNEQIACANSSWHINQNGIFINQDEQVIKAYGVRREPDYWSLHAMGELIGDHFRDAMRLKCPFLLHYGIHIPEQNRIRAKIQGRESWVEHQARSKIGNKVPIIKHQAKELDFIRHQLGRGERFVQTNFSALLFSTPQEISIHEQSLMTLFRSNRWQLQLETYLQLQVLLSCLPMNWGEGFTQELGYNQRLKTTLSTEAANLLPLQGEWKGTHSPGMMLVGRRGQIMTWSPFDNRSGNYNVAVVGRSGSGKSVFMQELMTSILGQGGRVFVLDVGRSFEKTVKLLEGTYLEFTPEATICINPFTTIPQDNLQETESALAWLKPVLSLMAAPTQGTTDLENALIEKAIMMSWQDKKEQACIDDIVGHLKNQSDPIAKTLAHKLFPYSSLGMYGRFFNGPSTVNLTTSMVVVELEELKERKDLQAVVVQMVIIQITNQLYLGDRKTPSLLVLDEAWDMLRAKQAGEFIETAARRLRKYGGALVVGTQSINDFYSTPGAQAAFDNSDWLCLLSQKKESIEQLKKTSRIVMDPAMEAMLNSIQTKQGEYAEIMIYGPHGYAVGRLMLDPFSKVLYSTQAQEFSKVQDYLNQGMTMTQAINTIAYGVN